MSASIMVFDHPHFVIPEPTATSRSPTSRREYCLSAWHERIGEREVIVVEAGRVVRIEFVLPVGSTDGSQGSTTVRRPHDSGDTGHGGWH
jgi:hypothetical protein